MNIYHKYELINNKLTCVIYVDYPTNYEFGLDFNAMKQKVIDLSSKVREYLLKINNIVTDDKALIVLNGIIAGTLIISNLNHPNVLTKTTKTSTNDTFQEINKLSTDIENQNILTSNLDTKLNYDKLKQDELNLQNKQKENIAKSKLKDSEQKSISNIKNNTQNSSQKNINTKSNTKIINNKNYNNTKPITNNTPNNNNNSNIANSINSGHKIKLKLNNQTILSIDLEEYVIGVVGAEMPATFNSEALKAQAVAARTYAMKKISNSQLLTATTSTQCYKTNDELKAYWGNSFQSYYSKIKNAVMSTKGQVIKYNGNYIDALYFSMSNGKTEDASNVWKNSINYLKSVDSPFDANLNSSISTKTIAKSVLNSKLNVNINSISQIKIKSKTVGNRVNIITIGNKDFTGVQIRTQLDLRSADFTIKESGNNFVFTTKGFGHGVGMSQYGANEMGKKGYTYRQILTHYYSGVNIVNI